MLAILRRQYFHTLAEALRAFGGPDIPTRTASGERDKAIPLARGREMHALLQGSHPEVFHDGGHCPHDEASARFNPLTVQFLFS